jgi:hypothetical protein
MAMNPMQRRARNSFLIGFLVSLIIMALVVVALLYKIKSINEAKEALEALQVKVYVASSDLESGEEVTLEDNFKLDTVQTTVNKSEIISDDDFEFTDEDGEIVEKYNDDGSIKKKTMAMKVSVPAGTIVTKDMIVEAGEETTDTDRIQEYNMLVLPSTLKNNDYIDIRLQLPSGQDFIVLSKKKVIGCTETSLWLQVDETELLTMSNAIVEAWTITGSKLYAIQYVEAGIQEASIPNYTVSSAVLDLINNDPNVTTTARNELWERYNSEIRNIYFTNGALANYVDSQDSSVNSGMQSEIESIKSARQSFVSELEGTDDIGYNR